MPGAILPSSTDVCPAPRNAPTRDSYEASPLPSPAEGLCPEGHFRSSALCAQPAHDSGKSVPVNRKLSPRGDRCLVSRWLDVHGEGPGQVEGPGLRRGHQVWALAGEAGGRREGCGAPGAAAWQVPVPRVGKFLISPARLPPLIYYSHEMLCSLLFSLLSPGLEEHRPPQAPGFGLAGLPSPSKG